MTSLIIIDDDDDDAKHQWKSDDVLMMLRTLSLIIDDAAPWLRYACERHTKNIVDKEHFMSKLLINVNLNIQYCTKSSMENFNTGQLPFLRAVVKIF